MAYETPRILGAYFNVSVKGDDYPAPREVYGFMTTAAKAIIEDFVREVKAGGIVAWEPLDKQTVAKREAKGSTHPTTPLYDTGRLLKAIENWRPRYKTFRDENGEVVHQIGMGPAANEDFSCIQKDMLWGNPHVGFKHATSVPARPLQLDEAMQGEFQRRLVTWLQGRGTPANQIITRMVPTKR